MEVGDWRLELVCNLEFLSYQLLVVICGNQRINLRKSARKNFPDVDKRKGKQRKGGREIRDWRLEIGDWGLEVGGWRLEIGDWRLGVGN